MESSTEEKEAWRKHTAWNAIHVTNLLFCCRQGSNLVFFSLALDCHESCFSTEVSIFLEDVSMICISNFILLNENRSYSTCRCGALWDCLLSSRILRLVMKTGFQPATSFLFLKHDWHQSSSETSFTVREAGSMNGSSVCQEHVGAWGKITLA